MPRGGRKQFSVLTDQNQKFMAHLIAFVLKNDFVSLDDIYLEYMKQPKTSNSSRHQGYWGMRPLKSSMAWFLRRLTFLKQSKYILITQTVSGKFNETKNTFWELTDNWPDDYIKYVKMLNDKLKRKKGLGGK
tara:strand:- start:70 stop:465 length:396 start_codon:yes stop_codon:yes gene_type:complete